MGMNKKIVPKLDRLKIELTDSPENIRYYRAADTLIGPSDSIEYLKLKFTEED
jgi:hypothetical protein